MTETVGLISLLGAGGFGAIIGWYTYYINRYRKGGVEFSDLATVIGIIGGGAITQLFDTPNTPLFGAYGIGLFVGFFGYFLTLLLLVAASKNFDADWFLDGRRKVPQPPFGIPDGVDRGAMLDAGNKKSPDFAAPVFNPTIVVNTRADEDDLALPSTKANEIIDQCEAVWDAHKDNCSGFAKAVATKFGVTLTGQANDIVDQIKGSAWTRLSDGAAAKAAADEGKLVIAGMKGADQVPAASNGHIVVVVSGPIHTNRYPSAYWGTLNGVGRKNTTLNYAWKSGDRDRITYACRVV